MIKHDGVKSRKLWITVFSCMLILAGGICIGIWPAVAPLYGTYCSTIITLTGFYFGSNLGEKHILGKHEVAMNGAEQSPAPK